MFYLKIETFVRKYKYFVLPYHKTLPYVHVQYKCYLRTKVQLLSKVHTKVQRTTMSIFNTCTKIHELYEGKSIYLQLLYLRNKVHVL